MKSYQEIQELWSQDRSFNEDNMLQRLLETASIQNKYFKLLISHRRVYNQLQGAHKTLYRDLREKYLHGPAAL